MRKTQGNKNSRWLPGVWGNSGWKIHAQGQIKVQKRPERTWGLHVQLNFGLHAARKWRLRQSSRKIGLALKYLAPPQVSVCKDQERWGFSLFLFDFPLQAFKEISIRSLTAVIMEQRLKDHTQTYSLNKNSLENSINKCWLQTSIINSKPWEGDLIPRLTSYIVKMSSFKLKNHKV